MSNITALLELIQHNTIEQLPNCTVIKVPIDAEHYAQITMSRDSMYKLSTMTEEDDNE